MDIETLVQLLQAAGYTTGHAHLTGVPEGQPDTVLTVLTVKDQLPPMTGVIEHLESEEPDVDCGKVVAAIERWMERYRLMPAPGGQIIWVYFNVPVACVEEADSPYALLDRINANGSSEWN